MRFIPVKQTLDMQFEGEPTTDRFNNIIPGVSEWRPVKVAQWWVDKTEEREGDSILRTVDTLHVHLPVENVPPSWGRIRTDRKGTRLNSSHVAISYAVFCLNKKTDVLARR